MQKVVIIGGGVIGLSLAYHLSQSADLAVELLERNTLTSGTSWHAAGIVGPLRATANMTRLAKYAGELFPRLEAESGMSTGYRQTGGYWLARDPARLDELQRIAALGNHMGLTARVVGPDEISIPGLNLDGVLGALAVVEDANVNPVDLCMAYARMARRQGATIRENIAVSRILVEQGRAAGVLLDDGTETRADLVALCAGAWSKRLADQAGVALPLQAVEHMYVVTEPMLNMPHPFPVLRDLDRGIYIKGDAGKLVIGGFEPDAKCWDAFGPEGDRPFLEMPEDWEQFTPFIEAALALIPELEQVGIQHFMNGPESFTVDTRPLIGETPEVDGLYVAAGMNSVGVMSSAGIGRLLAEWMRDRHPPVDLWEVDIARIDPLTASDEFVRTRMQEAVEDTFALHWPFKQPKVGRGLRKSPLHDYWAREGAHFGLTAGWERGLWYAQTEDERDLPYSVGAQPWQGIVEREAAILGSGTALLDLSPFSKFEISGPDALDFLQYLASANVDVAAGRAVYTPLLNARGGIEGDVTILRLADDHFRLTSGAATRARDAAWLRRQSKGRAVVIRDLTEIEAVIGVMGAGSREVLSSLSSDDWAAFPFSTGRQVTVAGKTCLAVRVSFVGELGWELYIPAAEAGVVFDALIAAGARPMGHLALDACRIEKGFRHMGHDLGPDITPYAAGLGFAVDLNKDFLGRAALQAARDEGLRQMLVLFDLPDHPLILHDELILEDGNVVGLTTSGAKGARTGKTLALGLITIAPGETLAGTAARRFQIAVAGRNYTAYALARPPFDPSGERMKA